MPALLALLRVDDIAASAATSIPPTDPTSSPSASGASTSSGPPPALVGEGGGMDWGVVAVYSCAGSCQKGTREWAVVQPPVGEEEV